MNKVSNFIKYAGADWLSRQIGGRSEKKALSTFGIRVANVLGQIYQGIYHIDSAVLNQKVRWSSPAIISVTVYGELATFDGPHLTMLVLCCQRAGLEVSIHESFKGYTKLVFMPATKNPTDFLSDEWRLGILQGSTWDGSQRAFLQNFVHIKKALWEAGLPNYTIPCMSGFSTEGLSWVNLQCLVAESHLHCFRVSVEGRSRYSLEVGVSQRKGRVGSQFDRHPTLEDHKAILEPYVGIDYGSLD